MTKFVERRCRACGEGMVRPVAKPGRQWDYKSVTLSVPADFEIPTCSNCGEEWLDPDRAEALDAVLDARYREMLAARFRDAVTIIVRHRSQRVLERLLHLSQGYVSHVLSGRKTPSPHLVLEVVLLAKEPDTRLREVEEALREAPPAWLAKKLELERARGS